MKSHDPANNRPTTAIRVMISGRVQGVGFRYSTQQQARQLGVSGWVRNRRNGTVEALFEGDPALVQNAVAWCHQGPAAAEVQTVETCGEPPQQLSDFEIRPTV
ncbi:MAG: acylphosphatase [Sodalinema sp.]|uniref:acylphosphatase n=1 Tax=Sodalinema sp. TaxID=3080550 RepID=UPI001225C550|nr:MAG: acylphosphatase [Phormidium sp. SL48-SHIP]